MAKGPKFIRFFWPIVEALREFGGSAQPREVASRVIEVVGISDDERAERTKSGVLRVDNQVHWARNYLVWAGVLDGSQRGRWALGQTGWSLPLAEQDQETAYDLFKQVRLDRRDEWGQARHGETTPTPSNPLHRSTPWSRLRALWLTSSAQSFSASARLVRGPLQAPADRARPRSTTEPWGRPGTEDRRRRPPSRELRDLVSCRRPVQALHGGQQGLTPGRFGSCKVRWVP